MPAAPAVWAAPAAELLTAPAAGWSLVSAGEGAATSVRGPRGAEIALTLPKGASLDTLAGDDRSWVAAGTRPLLRGRGSELVLVAGDGQGQRALPVPGGRTAAERASPTPILERGELAGLVWLEGAARGSYAVRAAMFDGVRWSKPETVSPQAPGSQLAPSAARLADGTWLLVWSRFDGHDDEIVWSTRRAGGWSAPRTLGGDNDVPDITPTLLATADGALVAWNHFDGSDYRVETARFDGREFDAPVTVGGAGWSAPVLASFGGRLLLGARQAEPRTFVVVELDARGAARRIASVPPSGRGRPWIVAAGDRDVDIVWSDDGGAQTLAWSMVP